MKSTKTMATKKSNYSNQAKPNSVKNLICHIKVMYYNNDPMLGSVDDVNVLYNALCDLDEIVGMDEVKDSIVKQIKFLLVNHVHLPNEKGDKSKFEGHMLHTVVFGPPGVGKTTVGSCLANIWKGLGLIEKKKPESRFGKNGSSGQNRSSGIRILPIPIFLIKEKSEKDGEGLQGDNKDNREDEARQLESNIRSYLNETNKQHDNEIVMPSGRSIERSSDSPDIKYNSDNKYSLPLSKYKKKGDTKTTGLGSEIKEIDDLINKEKNSVDDMKNYLKELAISRKKNRENNLLKCGVKNLMKSVDASNSKALLKRHKTDAPIKIVSRPDFVGQYVGHTCAQSNKLLTSTLEEGKVLFIDEAYSLILDSKDSFGVEAVNEINRFMSEHPDLIVIFAGYKDKMEDTLFKYQPGLKRRCTWMFEIADYTGPMIADIFKKQLCKEGWTFEGDNDELTKFFTDKITNFGAFGGDTVRLSLYCKLKYSELKFDYDTAQNLKDKTITMAIVKSAYEEMYCKNKPEKVINQSHLAMYC